MAMIEKQQKGERIRELSAKGLTPPEIIARGFNRATVYQALSPHQRVHKSTEAVLEDVLRLQIETLKILRRLAHEPDIIERLAALSGPLPEKSRLP